MLATWVWVCCGLAWAMSIVRRPVPRRFGNSRRLRWRRWLNAVRDAEASAVALTVLAARAKQAVFWLCGAVLLVITPPLGVAVCFAKYAAWPLIRERRSQLTRARALEKSLPHTVDVLCVAARAGLNVTGCICAAARFAPGVVGEQFAEVYRQIQIGRNIPDALDSMMFECGESVRQLVGILVASECDGVAIAVALDRLADEIRRTTQRQAEVRARKVPVKLLIPLALGTLPAFVLLILVPVIAQAVHSLNLG